MNYTYSEIDDVIVYIQNHLEDELPLSQLADRAAYSPFHFSRIFKNKTGMSPHQYVSSLRIQKAKSLLLNTNLTVRDISMEIHQQSLGTFTTRFTERVGMTPAEFRKSSRTVKKYLQSLKGSPTSYQEAISGSMFNRLEGTIEADLPVQGAILVGLFTSPIPAGLPKYGKLLTAPGLFEFMNVQPGTYYLMAAAVQWDMNIDELLVPHETLRAKADHPIQVAAGKELLPQSLHLRGPILGDPPILISLPLLIKNYLSRINSN
ncbi:AraC family transcriptional regulator [Alkalicoccus daliensis]|uniref:AraC family transcriptional regulator n=1 Tax=Alkalicoccus daliensis TaxID=745820 RepID=UPI001FCCDFD8|nr:AraC family transcriptional regulator [Alkalicoccus daliensis]